MIKAAGVTKDDRPLLVLGLSDENWARLRAGKPILFSTDELGGLVPSMMVVLLGAATEHDLAEDLRVMGAKPL